MGPLAVLNYLSLIPEPDTPLVYLVVCPFTPSFCWYSLTDARRKARWVGVGTQQPRVRFDLTIATPAPYHMATSAPCVALAWLESWHQFRIKNTQKKKLKISTAKTGLTTVTVYLLEICTALFDGWCLIAHSIAYSHPHSVMSTGRSSQAIK